MINSFKYIADNNCKVLILGTMPGVESLKKQQYYGNKNNTFWRIMYSLFNENPSEDYEQRKAFLLTYHIALWDVLASCERVGSADSDIKNPIPNDFATLFHKYPIIEMIFFNGQTAEKLFKKHVKDKVNINHLKFSTLPSTSPANVVRFEEKLMNWKPILYQLQGLGQV